MRCCGAFVPSVGKSPGAQDLTQREIDVLRLVCRGMTNKEIAQALATTAVPRFCESRPNAGFDTCRVRCRFSSRRAVENESKATDLRGPRVSETRATYGSRVRRSSRFIFLNTVDSIEDAVKKYYREYYRTQRSNEPKPLNIWLPE
jgi:hypothetical protein